MDQTNINVGSKESIAEGNVNGKRKRGSRISDDIKIMNPVESLSNVHLSDGMVTENECLAKDFEISVSKESSLSVPVHNKENPLEFCKDEDVGISVRKESSLIGLPDVVEVLSNQVSSEIVGDMSEHFFRPMGVERKFILCKIDHSSHPCQIAGENVKIENGLYQVRDETVINEGQCSAEGGSIFSFGNVEGTSHLSSPGVKEAECLSKDLGPYPGITPISSITRKLIVLDVNGLLANIVMPAPKDFRGDAHILGRAIFKRPFCDDFLKFCFQNFVVGVWSSRSKRIIERVVDYLLGDQKDKLLFCWDMSHSTQTGFNTLENIHKPLVFKELRKIWENDDPSLPWKSGVYNESNTLLLDDSPYKALLNPLCTAIFPSSFHYKDTNDNSLGPGGDLRVYLEGLVSSENVQKYVEQHPFGQSAIDETNMSWGFYSGVLQTMSNQMQDDTPSSVPALI
ncbi:Haloacid dehalogenase-like hydrolase superfamily protein [Perilla frutescens var. frutescens]|nr:Haloacid dehalogenase-like hydrolase superfamily protein [Perilla frutescens var. frutescens]